ncbi:hypothetical protein CS060_00875 [Anoxybacillus flavithermus]|uniref:Copper amine oxidase-like N-terminal domain-containing protein n=1 Tax=Anoxybacillus flavithermus TaxID=33934 RepID=A0A2G5RTW9_9BACL|nr:MULTISPECIES: hypothetical protein [Anoxybacillus]KFZ43610.1 hypothetical protein JS80_01970 [Anoxybacillus sp. KU2-6(11)]PIC06109.1 hypothetical protein CS060_00875 [Anoxybacillus flavithermus]
MWKVAFISTLLFLGVSAGALYYQWDEYHTEATKQSVLQHDIEATFTGKTIEVVHHIRGAVADIYEVTVPKEVTRLSCLKQKTCVKQQNGKTIVNVSKTNTVSLTYRIPIAPKEPLFVQEWLVRFHTTQPQQTNISLTDIVHQKGVWAADGKLVGYVYKPSFSFFMWEKKGGQTVPLYFQSQPLQPTFNDDLVVYATKPLPQTTLSFWKKSDVQTLIVTSSRLQYMTPTFVIISDTSSFANVQRTYVRVQLQQQFPNSVVPDWIWDLLVSYMTKTEPMTKKAKLVFQQLQQTLTKEEQQTFWTLVNGNAGQPLTMKKLDEWLGEAYGGNTTFFQNEQPYMTFTERKMLVVNGVELPNAHVLLKDGQQLFPFVPIMRTLGYTVQRSGEAIFIEKGNARWRFFTNSTNAVIQEWDGTLYVERTEFPKWFSVYISETNEEIHVVGQ